MSQSPISHVSIDGESDDEVEGGEGCSVDLLEKNEGIKCHGSDNVVIGGVNSPGVEKDNDKEGRNMQLPVNLLWKVVEYEKLSSSSTICGAL